MTTTPDPGDRDGEDWRIPSGEHPAPPPPATYAGAYPAPPPAAYPLIRPSNGVATAGGVCGIVAAAISWVPLINVFSLVLSIIAVALGGVGFARANKLRQQTGEPIGRGMAITGIVLGCIGLAIALIFIVALGSALNDLSRTTPGT